MDAKFTVQLDRPEKSRFTAKVQKARIELCLSLWHEKDTKGYLLMKHLSGKHDCFKYSFVMKGVLCVSCVLFRGDEVANDSGKYTELINFVTTPFQKYEKISDKIKDHLSTKYHSLSQEKAEMFIQWLSDSSEDVAYQLSEQHRKVAFENLERLVLVIETSLL